EVDPARPAEPASNQEPGKSPATECVPGVDPVFGAGVLRGDCRILSGGLTKKTISVVMDDGKKYRVISYYLRSDVLEGKLKTPETSPALASVDSKSERLLGLLPFEARGQLPDGPSTEPLEETTASPLKRKHAFGPSTQATGSQGGAKRSRETPSGEAKAPTRPPPSAAPQAPYHYQPGGMVSADRPPPPFASTGQPEAVHASTAQSSFVRPTPSAGSAPAQDAANYHHHHMHAPPPHAQPPPPQWHMPLPPYPNPVPMPFPRQYMDPMEYAVYGGGMYAVRQEYYPPLPPPPP
ncbi:hypothetical protein HK405_013042, partial [Cladochytrium tenue]